MTRAPGQRQPLRSHRRAAGDRGASLLEYVLLLALVAMAGVGSLIYLGNGSSSASHVANQVAIGLNNATPSSADWCTSSSDGCTLSVVAQGSKYIFLTAGGGTPPYAYSLQDAPAFLSLDGAMVTISPACSDAGVSSTGRTYTGITIVATDSTGKTGDLSFSLTVKPGDCAPVP